MKQGNGEKIKSTSASFVRPCYVQQQFSAAAIGSRHLGGALQTSRTADTKSSVFWREMKLPSISQPHFSGACCELSRQLV